MNYAALAVGCKVAPHVPCLGGKKVWRAAPAYSEPMDDRLEVVLVDEEYPDKITYCCVLKWPEDFVRRPTFKLKATPAARPFKLKGR